MNRRSLLGAGLVGLALGCRAEAQTRGQAAVARHDAKYREEMVAAGLTPGAPIFLRVYKDPGTLQVFVETEDGGPFQLFKSFDICRYSGGLGPKFREGDGKTPEGFYYVPPEAMNTYSTYHLSFNLGFPNAYDRAHGRTGSYLMVHGSCVSIGCYAMTDAGIEQIWTLMQMAYGAGQRFIRVHAFPFEMTEVNLAARAGHDHLDFWNNLAEGWQWFESHRRPPDVRIRDKRYIFSQS